MPGFPLINGNRFSFADILLSIAGGFPEIGVRSVNYSDNMDPTIVRGTSTQPIGRTRGDYLAEGSITMLLSDATVLIEELGPGYMEVVFDIEVTYDTPGETTSTDTLVGCRIKNRASAHTQGPDGLEVTMDLSLMHILINGVPPFRGMIL